MREERNMEMEIGGRIEKLMAKAKEKQRSGERMTSYSCLKCSDTTWILTDKGARRCSCFEMGIGDKLLRESGIELEQRSKTFGNYKPHSDHTRKALQCGKSYFKNFKVKRNTRYNSIAFLGQVGSGKTHLSLALALNLIAKDIPVVYMPFRDTMMRIKLNMLDNEFYKKTIERYQKAKVLLIDDLYKGKVTQSDVNIMFEIINYRYMNHLPMIISSEKTIEDMLKVDEPIGSRIYEMCRENVVEIKGRGNNYRMRGWS